EPQANQPQEKPLPLLEGFENPEAIDANSILVSRINEEDRSYQFYRYRPDALDQKPPEPIGPKVRYPNGWPAPLRVFRDGRQAVFCGQLADDPAGGKRLYLFDLNTGEMKPFASHLRFDSEFVRVATDPDGREVYTVLPAGDLFQMVAIPREDGGPERTLFYL